MLDDINNDPLDNAENLNFAKLPLAAVVFSAIVVKSVYTFANVPVDWNVAAYAGV